MNKPIKFSIDDMSLRDSDLRNMEISQRTMDSILANVPDGFTVECIKDIREDKVFVRMKPIDHFANISKMMIKTTVE